MKTLLTLAVVATTAGSLAGYREAVAAVQDTQAKQAVAAEAMRASAIRPAFTRG